MQLPEGLSTATALTELTIDNERMSLDILWEDLAELLPHLPLLQASAALDARTLRTLALQSLCSTCSFEWLMARIMKGL